MDECDERNSREQLIDKLYEVQASTDLRLLFTSRFISEIMERFQSSPRLEVIAKKEDVICFVTGQISRLPKCIQRDEELKHAVGKKIVEAVDGM